MVFRYFSIFSIFSKKTVEFEEKKEPQSKKVIKTNIEQFSKAS
jgi:hypothetical protein